MDGEEQDHAGKVEDEEGYGIVEPVLLTRGINTGQAKKGAFEKSQDPDRCVLTGEDPGHVGAEWPDRHPYGQNNTAINCQPCRVMRRAPGRNRRTGGAPPEGEGAKQGRNKRFERAARWYLHP
jgi:hypothetical protein